VRVRPDSDPLGSGSAGDQTNTIRCIQLRLWHEDIPRTLLSYRKKSNKPPYNPILALAFSFVHEICLT
jgi:hypothetical protein